MLYVMNGTCEDLTVFKDKHAKIATEALNKAGFTAPLTEDFLNEHKGEGALAKVSDYAEISCSGGVLHNGKLFIVMAIEYHYRNDSTRKLWGNPAKLETDFPGQKEQTALLFKHAARAVDCIPDTVMLQVNLHEYDQANGTSTDDRHVLMFMFEYPAHKGHDLISLVQGYIA
jgi:hypothetical protein